MLTGVVEGTVVATAKDPALIGVKLLLVRLSDNDKPGKLVVAGDATRQAGINDHVTMIRAKEAALMFKDIHPPCDLAITGFIDEYNLDDKFSHNEETPVEELQLGKIEETETVENLVPTEREDNKNGKTSIRHGRNKRFGRRDRGSRRDG
ncbi:MAG: Ethanolamine utilization protein EutN/carboxysome [Clostridiales bacterium]|jgi:microcompartment protein CcmK/EutM|nr:Ethanolamine utilization protein EutN/carboxysome [Clostridiales bacterium]